MFKGIFGSVAAALLLSAVTATAGEIPGATPDDFRANPALPSQSDLVRFDNSEPALPVHLDELGANQGAFPVYYGTTPPATDAPARLAATTDTALAVAPAAPMPSGDTIDTGLIPGGTANILSPTMAHQSVVVTSPPQPEALGGGTQLASALPGNASSPDYGLPAAPGRPFDAAPTQSMPRTSAVGTLGAEPPAARVDDKALDGTPMPPPPLPELAAGAAPAALPVDVNLVRADFNRLKAFCDQDSLGSAAEVYARMADFGPDEEVNRLRADAANLLILGLARTDNLPAARRIYESVPVDVPGGEAALAKARGVINLATYYVRGKRSADAYEVLMDIGGIPNRSALNSDLFRLMARMIPYLDDADQTDKATAVFDLLMAEVTSPGAAALFAENVPGVFEYYLHYVDKSESPRNRRKRLDFLEHAFASMERLSDNRDVLLARKTLGENLAARYAGDPERAALFYVED